MKNTKKIVVVALILVLLGGGGAAYASTLASPLDILSDATGTPVDTILENRGDGETLGSMAADEGVLEEFQEAMTANREAVIQQRVEEGRLTQEEADEIKAAIQERTALCDGTGDGERLNLGQQAGLGFGQQGSGQYGSGSRGQGGGRYGMGGLGTGTCIVE